MDIPAKATIGACEAALSEFADGSSGHLKLPTHLRSMSVGGEISWVQFLLTWAARDPDRIISTFARSAADKQISELTSKLYGTMATLCADRLLSVGGRTDLTSEYKHKAIERLQKLQTLNPHEATRGPAIEVIAADSLGYATPESLYRRSSDGHFELGDRDFFVRSIPQLLKRIAPTDRDLLHADEMHRAIGTLLYETFKNTEDHGMTQLDGRRIDQSFRLFQANYTAQLPESLLESSLDYVPLREYFTRFSPSEGSAQLKFVGISALDAGLGFAQTWTKKQLSELSLEEELEATVACFSHGTSKRSDRFGKGLPLVRAVLKRRSGFLRLRTGRLSLYYDAAQDGDGLSQPIPLKSWSLEGGRPLAQVRGTLVTMIIPAKGTR